MKGDPYYPVPRKENAEFYAKYKALADDDTGVHFVGRLATYKYYNMDQIVAQALTVYAKMHSVKRKDALRHGQWDHAAATEMETATGKARHLPVASATASAITRRRIVRDVRVCVDEFSHV